jgi:hypothetical protein
MGHRAGRLDVDGQASVVGDAHDGSVTVTFRDTPPAVAGTPHESAIVNVRSTPAKTGCPVTRASTTRHGTSVKKPNAGGATWAVRFGLLSVSVCPLVSSTPEAPEAGQQDSEPSELPHEIRVEQSRCHGSHPAASKTLLTKSKPG